jgi:hypothetical protein
MILKIVMPLVALVSIILAIAAFTKRKYTIVREITVNRPRQEVFDYISHFRNQPEYSKWLLLDPNTKIDFSGTDGEPGFTLSFNSKNKKAGKGEQEIKKIIRGERVEYDLRFLEPFEFVANGYTSAEAITENQTRVKWVYNSGMKYPMNILLLFMDMEKIIGTDAEETLGNMKSRIERK